MSKHIRTILLAGISCLTLACGSDSKDENLKAKNVDEFAMVGDSNASANDSGLTGQGNIVFKNNLGSIESGKRFELTFSLAADATLAVVTYAANDLSGGIEIEFVRHNDHLDVEIFSGGEHTEVSEHFAAIDPTEVIQLAIEVHNDESPAHVMVENLADQSLLLDSEGDHADHEHGHHDEDEHEDHSHEDDEHNADADHDDHEESIVRANGTNTFWGLRLSEGVVVNMARAVEAVSAH